MVEEVTVAVVPLGTPHALEAAVVPPVVCLRNLVGCGARTSVLP